MACSNEPVVPRRIHYRRETQAPPPERVESDTAVLRAQIDSLTQRVSDLTQRVTHVETGQSGQASAAAPQDPTSLVTSTVTAGDAPRSFRIPGTNVSLRFGGFAKFDASYDRGVMLAGSRYFPDLIAVGPSAARKGLTTFSAGQSRFSVNAQAPTKFGLLRAFIEMDFYGAKDTAHLRHAFGQAGWVTGGYTWSTLMDLSSLPPTVTFTAPSGAIYAPQPLVRVTIPVHKGTDLAMALEGPRDPYDVEVKPPPGTDVSLPRFPDFIATFRYAKGTKGHFQLGVVARRVGVLYGSGATSFVNGGGVLLSGHISPIGKDSFGFGGIVGKGIGNYIAGLATSPAAAAPSALNTLQTLRTEGGYANYLHWWNKQFRSTIAYGYVQVRNSVGQGPTAVKSTQSAIGNLVWAPLPGFGVGLEYLYGRRKNKNGAVGKDPRIQFGIQFGFS